VLAAAGIDGANAGQYSETDFLNKCNGLADIAAPCLQRRNRCLMFFGGEAQMKTVTTWVLVAVVMFGWAGKTLAVKPVCTDRPFLNVTTNPDRLDLGMAPFMGPLELKAALTVEVEANCLHGPIYLSATPLNRQNGHSIGSERISVRTAETNGYVAMNRPVAISKPAKGSHKVVVDVKVDTPAGFPAGEYNGVFTFMIMPPV
jgi:hypothetical protein